MQQLLTDIGVSPSQKFDFGSKKKGIDTTALLALLKKKVRQEPQVSLERDLTRKMPHAWAHHNGAAPYAPTIITTCVKVNSTRFALAVVLELSNQNPAKSTPKISEG